MRQCKLIAWVAVMALMPFGRGAAAASDPATDAAEAQPVSTADASDASDAVEPARPEAAADADEPTPALLPSDFETMSRDELIGLVRALVLQNQMLIDSRREAAERRPAERSSERPAIVDRQSEVIGELRGEVARLRDELARLRRRDQQRQEQVQQVEAEQAAAEDLWEYRFVYEYGLVRRSGDGRAVVRKDDGDFESIDYSYDEYRDDQLWLNLLIRNDSGGPKRFSGVAVLMGNKPLFAERAPVYGSLVVSTPMLEPGEVFQINEVVQLNDPLRVREVELTDMRAFD